MGRTGITNHLDFPPRAYLRHLAYTDCRRFMAYSHYVQLPHCNGTDNHLPTVIARRVPIHWSWITSVLRRVCNALGARVRYRQKTCRYSGAFGFHLVPCRYRETIAPTDRTRFFVAAQAPAPCELATAQIP